MTAGEESDVAHETMVGGEDQAFVLVGVDGSAPSSKALVWAAEEARLRGAALRVLYALALPTFDHRTHVPDNEFENDRAEAKFALDSQIADVLGARPGIQVEREVATGPVVSIILEAAKGAELLVVGSRGRGGFAGLVLGSVSSQVVHHSPCPVTVVPA
jgi:nucleotide-binding universal stress UspA family protein